MGTPRIFGDDEDDSSKWKRRANCKGLANPVSIFFSQQPKAAKLICNDCHVQSQCLDYANDWEKRIGWRSGVYGGLTPNERDAKFGRTSLGRRFKAESNLEP